MPNTFRFWDKAIAGELCMVPCHNTNENGDITEDCFNNALVTMRADGLVDTQGGLIIDPKVTVFICRQHSGQDYSIWQSLV